MKDRLKTSKGITLIALVITIIVLLILAGIAISMLSGENGILNQATNAKEKTEEGEAREKIRLSEQAARAENEGEITKKSLETELKKYFGEEGYKIEDIKDEEDKVIGYKVKVGKVEEIIEGDIVEEKITAADIKNNADAIGTLVKNYKPIADQTTEWRIFFADSSHIYLIAKDYIERDKLPSTRDGHKPNDGEETYPRAAYFTGVKEDYKDKWVSMVKENAIKDTLSIYHKWTNEEKNQSNDFDSIKSIAYMLDTEIWTKQYGTEKAEYVIGGPTLEMFCESYNKKTHTNEKGTIEYDLFRDNTTLPGYKLKWSIDSSYGDENAGVVLSGLDTTEYTNLYVINSMNNASAYWIPSVPFNSGNSLFNCKYSGKIGSNGYTNGEIGFRPLVCLKSNVILVGNSTDGYTIQ